MNPVEFLINMYRQHMLAFPEVTDKFKSLKTNHERVDYACNFLGLNSNLSEMPFFCNKVEKCNDTSVNLRMKGNREFLGKKNLEALLLYTKSVAYAENDSDCLGVAYGNRSAALFERGFYKECLEDIARALENNYPSHLKPKLLTRQEQANILEKQTPMKSFRYYEPAPNIPNKHPRISAAANCVELKTNDSFGTHVVATRDIKAGEIISVEKPFVYGVARESANLHCHQCLELCYNIIPCKNCATALYCSESCRTTAFTSYHRYECDYGSVVPKDVLFVKSTLLNAMEYKRIEEHGDDDDQMYRSDRPKEMYHLATNENVSDNPLVFLSAMQAGVIFRWLKNRTKFLEENDLDENMLKEIILHNILTEISNCLGIQKFELVPKRIFEQNEPITVGRAIYAFSSRYNHSCAPNCFGSFHGRSVAIRAMKDINRGEQCTISYGYSYFHKSLADRQTLLKLMYNFTCKCIACKNSWPTYTEIQNENIVELVIDTVTRGHKNTNTSIVLKHILKLLKDLNEGAENITRIDKDEMIGICFYLQRLMVEPCEAFVFIQQLLIYFVFLVTYVWLK